MKNLAYILPFLFLFTPFFAQAANGATWTDQTAAGSRIWRSITSSSDGTELAAAVFGGDIYTSTNGGAAWTNQTAAGSRNWYTITSSSDGTELAAGGVLSGRNTSPLHSRTPPLHPPLP